MMRFSWEEGKVKIRPIDHSFKNVLSSVFAKADGKSQ